MAKPIISVSNANIIEGNDGISIVKLSLKLNQKLNKNITIEYSTVDGTAKTIDNDYQKKTGNIIFSAGETSKEIGISINSDTKVEPDEVFNVKFTNKSSKLVSINKSKASVTIKNDDLENIKPVTEVKPVVTKVIRGTDTQLSESEMTTAKVMSSRDNFKKQGLINYTGDYFSSEINSSEREIFHFKNVSLYSEMFIKSVLVGVVSNGNLDTKISIFDFNGNLVDSNDDVGYDYTYLNTMSTFNSYKWKKTDSVLFLDREQLDSLKTSKYDESSEFYVSVEASGSADATHDHGAFLVGIM